MQTVEVKLWNTTIGTLGYAPGQKRIATFEFDKKFMSMRISPSPLKLNINTTLHSFEDISTRTFHGLPGFIADSLPDKFGTQLIDLYFASKGISENDITALDRLLYVGNRGMGALEYVPATDLDTKNNDVILDINSLSEIAEMLLAKQDILSTNLKKSEHQQAVKLLQIGSSAGGARAKALVAIDNNNKFYDGTVVHEFECKYYLVKFDSSNNSDRDNKDPKGMTRVEYIYSLIAKACDITMPETTYIEIDDDFHFLIERFDRVQIKKSLQKLHYVSWCGMAHAHRDTTGTYSYEQLVMTARELGLGQDTVLEIFKRAVFNIVGRNQDDHTKNFGFLMNKKAQWQLSPAFDMTYSYDPTGKWTNVHQIRLNNKQSNFLMHDFISFGSYCNLTEKKVIDIVMHTIKSFSRFSEYAEEYRVSQELKETVLSNLISTL
jgi:serine/threonine-protein kinase HipA